MPPPLAHFHTRLNFGATCRQHLVRDSTYNARGWRVKKLVDNSDTLDGTFRMIYNQSWQLLEILSVSGGSTTVAKQFIHAGPGVTSVPSPLSPSVPSPYIDDHIAMLTPSGGGWTAHYYHSDGLFNTLAMSDGSAAIAERAQFEPYGTASLTNSGGSPITVSAIGNPFERQGITRDWETGDDVNRHRSYAPGPGRWVQRDPLSSYGQILARDGFGSATNLSGAASMARCGSDPYRPIGPIIEYPELDSAVRSSASATGRSLVEFVGGKPSTKLDPSGLFAITDPWTGPAVSSCCTPVITPTAVPVTFDDGSESDTRVETCGPCVSPCGPVLGTQVCTYTRHYFRLFITTTTTTVYIKSSSPECLTAVCPPNSIVVSHWMSDRVYGSTSVACTECVCP